MEHGNCIVTEKISRLKAKQKTLETSWHKTGSPSLLEFFIDIIPDMLNAERCSIFIFNPSTDMLWLYRGTDVQEGQIQVARKGSMAGEALSAGKYMVFTELEDKAGIHEIVDNITEFTTCNTLSLPIFDRSGNQAIGVLQILNKRSRDGFTKDDIRLMQRLTGIINRFIERIFKHQQVAEILFKIKKKIRGLENSLAKDGAKQRLDDELITSMATRSISKGPGRLH